MIFGELSGDRRYVDELLQASTWSDVYDRVKRERSSGKINNAKSGTAILSFSPKDNYLGFLEFVSVRPTNIADLVGSEKSVTRAACRGDPCYRIA